MKRAIHNFVQGSPEWHAYRATPNQFNASDAPAMLGESPYKSRDQLLKELATGSSQEVTAMVQRKFDDGHRFEEEDRSRAEGFIGQELYPATVSVDLGELKLSSSLDGWTMCEAIIYEHKTKNKMILEFAARGEIPLLYRIQMEQQLLCSGADKCLFSASNGAADDEPVRIWYFPDSALRARIILGWEQIAIDLANYVVQETIVEAVAEEVEMLPSIDIRTNGQISVVHNLAVFEQKLTVFLSEKLIRKPQTDNDFATLSLQIKAMKDAEEKLKAAGGSILAQIEAVDAAMRKRDSLNELVRQNRLMAEKLLDSEKERRKREIVDEAKAKMQEHINVINDAIFKANVSFPAVYLPAINVDFLSAIKGKKTIKSLIESANDELARGKIEANRIAGIIDSNLELLNMIAVGYDGLFADIQQLVLKDKEALNAIAQQRINTHKQNEQLKIQAAAKQMADEQLERDRQAEAQRVADLAKQNEVVSPAAQAPDIQSRVARDPLAQDEIVMRTGTMSQRPAAAQQSFGGLNAASAIVDECPVHEVQLNDYQRGIIAGLELAVRIHANCLRSNADFISAINAVCTSDNIPAAPISKAA